MHAHHQPRPNRCHPHTATSVHPPVLRLTHSWQAYPETQPLFLHLVHRRPAVRRLQALRLRQGHLTFHSATRHRIIARIHHGHRAGRKSHPRRRWPELRAFPSAQVWPFLLQDLAAGPQKAHGRPRLHRRKPTRISAGVQPGRVRHVREL